MLEGLLIAAVVFVVILVLVAVVVIVSMRFHQVDARSRPSTIRAGMSNVSTPPLVPGL
jgi:type IV secretory pathway TrbD component